MAIEVFQPKVIRSHHNKGRLVSLDPHRHILSQIMSQFSTLYTSKTKEGRSGGTPDCFSMRCTLDVNRVGCDIFHSIKQKFCFRVSSRLLAAQTAQPSWSSGVVLGVSLQFLYFVLPEQSRWWQTEIYF